MNHCLPLAAALTLLPAALAAQTGQALTGTSRPQPVAIATTIPAPRDVPYRGTIQLSVDATDVARGVFTVAETIPVAPGRSSCSTRNGYRATTRRRAPPIRSPG